MQRLSGQACMGALDADLVAAFDRIDHAHRLQAIGGFPASGMIAEWLKAGVFEPGKGFAPTEEGTPQGGVISPLLLNVALHGLEEAAGVRYVTAGAQAGDTKASSPVLVRYADDLVVLCRSQEQAQQIKARLAEWLTPRGLAFNEGKTKIVHLSQGFDFLGFNVRRYDRKLLIKPSKAAIRRVRERLAAEMRTLRGSNAMAVIAKLNPIIRGWAAYYRGVVSSRLFDSLDAYMWKLLYKWSAAAAAVPAPPAPASRSCPTRRVRLVPGAGPPVRSLCGPPQPRPRRDGPRCGHPIPGWRSCNPSSRLTCPSVPAILAASLQQLTCLTSARFHARAPGPVSGQLCSTPGGRTGTLALVSCCLSAAGIRFLGILSRPGLVPLLRSAYRAARRRRGPERGFHVPHA